ncbi:MAG: ABC transporter permease subunit [Chloroflexi bacterium]|nr:ABC transporter permease subunit [Chloroflexota bacterium]
MRSPEREFAKLERALWANELRNVLAGRALWVMLLMLSPLVGYGFIQAVNLFSQASVTALQFPELARGMTPLDGIFVPTFGAFYLAVTLLFPFVAIRLIGNEKQSGSLKLLLQLPMGLSRVVAIKVAALAVAWLLALTPGLSALVIWLGLGGHGYGPELLNLLLGHALYTLAITAISFFAAAVTESAATAAIVALAFTIGSWVLDFAASGQTGWVQSLSSLSLTAALRVFERGLFASPQLFQLLILSLSLLALTVVWLPTGDPLPRKLKFSAAIIAVTGGLLFLSAQFSFYVDVSENRRNSFNPADEQALKQMIEPLHITIYMTPDDPRLQELERNVLSKLRHTVPNLTITYADTGQTGLFGATNDDRYGLIVYEYASKTEESRSNSPREILPILHQLAGQSVTPTTVAAYPGYPLVTDAAYTQIWFYLLLPALFGLSWWLSQRTPKLEMNYETQT